MSVLFGFLQSKIFADENISYTIYGEQVHPRYICTISRDALLSMQLLLPFAISLGWIPQADTLLHHTLEQVHIHIFGGSGTHSLPAALVACIFNSAALALTWWLVFPSFAEPSTVASPKNTRISGSVGLAVAWAYFACRAPTDLRMLALLWQSVEKMEAPYSELGAVHLLVSSGEYRKKRIKDAGTGTPVL